MALATVYDHPTDTQLHLEHKNFPITFRKVLEQHGDITTEGYIRMDDIFDLVVKQLNQDSIEGDFKLVVTGLNNERISLSKSKKFKATFAGWE
jgi:hypothetical protein